ncbi:Transcription-repair-coupling factor [Streptomyces tendae]
MDLVPALREPLKKVLGPATAKVMAEHLGLHTVGDLLHHYPRRYEERGQLTHLADLPMDEHVTVVAQVADARLHTFASSKAPRGKGQRLEVTITDGSGRLQLVFFGNGVHKPHKELLPGTRAMFAGKVSVFNRRLQLAHPAYELLRGDTEGEETVESWAGALIPLYPATAKLESWKLAKAIQTVLPSAQEAVDPLPGSLREGRGLVSLPEALLKIHRPHTKADIEDARARLKWDEAFVLQVALARRRHAETQLPAVPRKPGADGLLTAFDDRLPFTLTDGQQKVSREIFDDLATDHPMHRLLQGEVGSGKTLVALRAMLAVVDSGGQAVMLAPTEVLAQQHHRSVVEMMGELAEGGMLGGAEHATKVVLLTGSMGAAARRHALLDLATGEAGIVIGTHALIEDKVQFHDLGLVVVDEQHRFGVEQRDALRGKGKQPPHLLVMTATPIPRTVAMTVFGDLETSVLDQLPAGRSPIASHVVPAADKPHFLARAWERVREEVSNGQAWRRSRGARGTSCSSRPTPVPPARSGRTSRPSVCPAPRSGRAKRNRSSAPRPRRSRTTSSSWTRRTPSRTTIFARSCSHSVRRGGSGRKRSSPWSAAPGAANSAGRTASKRSGPVATARERFGTVAPPLRAKTHDDRTGERGNTSAPCRLSRVVRPDHQRTPRHHRPGLQPL